MEVEHEKSVIRADRKDRGTKKMRREILVDEAKERKRTWKNG